MGGLTVLRSLRSHLPLEDFVYLGDTARLPYGTKSSETVSRYAMQAAGKLLENEIKALVVACNTASSFSLRTLIEAYAPIPIYGVIEPGAIKACQDADSTGILILATESTVFGGAYQRSILNKKPEIPVYARACSLWVTLAEQGLDDRELAFKVIEHYFLGFIDDGPMTVLLGCTHFPILTPLIKQVLGDRFIVVDSAETTAQSIAADLTATGCLNDSGGNMMFLATDSTRRFQKIGKRFLGEDLKDVIKVDL